MIRIGRAVLPVTDLTGAISWYRTCFEFRVLFDQELFPGFRSVHIGPGDVSDPGIWLFPAEHPNPAQEPALVLYCTDITTVAARLNDAHAPIIAPITGDVDNRSLQVQDPWGNIIVVAEAGDRHEGAR